MRNLWTKYGLSAIGICDSAAEKFNREYPATFFTEDLPLDVKLEGCHDLEDIAMKMLRVEQARRGQFVCREDNWDEERKARYLARLKFVLAYTEWPIVFDENDGQPHIYWTE